MCNEKCHGDDQRQTEIILNVYFHLLLNSRADNNEKNTIKILYTMYIYI